MCPVSDVELARWSRTPTRARSNRVQENGMDGSVMAILGWGRVAVRRTGGPHGRVKVAMYTVHTE